MSEGAGDRPGVKPSAGGDRPIRAARATLFDLAGKAVATITIVADAWLPQLVMFEGEPFLRVGVGETDPNYCQVRAFRADGLEVRP